MTLCLLFVGAAYWLGMVLGPVRIALGLLVLIVFPSVTVTFDAVEIGWPAGIGSGGHA